MKRSIATKAAIGLVQFAALLHGIALPALPQDLRAAEQRVLEHFQQQRPLLSRKEQAFKQLANQELEFWKKGKKYSLDGNQIDGPGEDPWYKQPNRESKEWFKGDSRTAWSEEYLTETWSCFQPQLVATVDDCTKPPRGAEPDLMGACHVYCCLGDLMPQAERWEVIQFWIPEHHASVNNYARLRVNPQDLTGRPKQDFMPQRLRQRKRQQPEKRIRQELAETYPLEEGKIKEPVRDEPYTGQYQWGGVPGDDIQRFGVHVYRSHFAVETAQDRPNSPFGWASEKRTIFDALAPQLAAKPHLNIWTEYDVFDTFTVIDSLGFLIFQEDKRALDFYQAHLEKRGEVLQRMRDTPPGFYQQGFTEVAYRPRRWPDPYKPIEEIAEVQTKEDEKLKETTYHGGGELYPLSMSMEGFAQPNLSLRSLMARRAWEIAGMESLERFFPEQEKSRINTYTIDGENKELEVDKQQLTYPLGPDQTPSECYRSQRIPHMVEQTESQWVKENLPSDLMGYVKEDNADSNHLYWNKRVACTCRIDSIFGTGSMEMDWVPDRFGPGRGSGDRIYGRIERSLCEYKEGELPSAWAGMDRPTCENDPNTKVYEGIDDNIP